MSDILCGWFDNSDRDDGEHAVSCVAGCVGTSDQWDKHEAVWRAEILSHFGLRYMHMREIRASEGPFAQFKNKQRARELSDAIVGTFKKSGVRPIASITRLSDLRRFNEARGRDLDDYALNIYKCMNLVKMGFERELVGDSLSQLNVDSHGVDTGPAIQLAKHYARTDPVLMDIVNYVEPLPLPHGKAASVPALQTADFVAWECRRFVEHDRAFWDARPDGESNQQLRAARTAWAVATGQTTPFKRGSMRAFMRATNALLSTWTYNTLCFWDDARKGVWTDADASKINRVC